jgi:hypothetical protein
MDIRPIRTETDYETALREIEPYFDREPEADRFDVLATLIEAYEREHWPIDPQTRWKPSAAAWSSKDIRSPILPRCSAPGRAPRRS